MEQRSFTLGCCLHMSCSIILVQRSTLHPAHCAVLHVQVAPEYLANHVDRLLQALLVCFFDESWPVRDAACVASGRFAGAYPDECRPSLDKLYERCETSQASRLRPSPARGMGRIGCMTSPCLSSKFLGMSLSPPGVDCCLLMREAGG